VLPAGPVDVLTEGVEMGMLEGATNARQVEQRVTWHLSRNIGYAMKKTVFYDKEAFEKVHLPKTVHELVELGEQRTPFQTARLNRE
jgi:hypothetical protein